MWRVFGFGYTFSEQGFFCENQGWIRGLTDREGLGCDVRINGYRCYCLINRVGRKLHFPYLNERIKYV